MKNNARLVNSETKIFIANQTTRIEIPVVLINKVDQNFIMDHVVPVGMFRVVKIVVEDYYNETYLG